MLLQLLSRGVFSSILLSGFIPENSPHSRTSVSKSRAIWSEDFVQTGFFVSFSIETQPKEANAINEFKVDNGG
jgi:hypothetical protein